MTAFDVRLVQLSYGDDETVAERTARVVALIGEQRGADLVVLPELWPHGGFAYRTWAERAEPLDGPTVTAVAAAAREAGVAVHLGSLIERGGGGPLGRNLWNTAVVQGADGRLAAAYRKIHRFGFGAGEPHLLEAGTEPVTVSLPTRGGGEVVLGLATCYDLRFPEMFRALVARGAEVLVVPAAWPAARIAHWSVLARARAVENQCAVLACGTAGTHAGTPMGGYSVVVDAHGAVLAEAGTAQEVLGARLDMAAQRAWRSDFPVLGDIRADIQW